MHLAATQLAPPWANEPSVPSILVVDDDPIFRGVILRALKFRDVSAAPVAASDGAEALELLKRQRFDLVITDDQMPLMTGIELIEACEPFDARPQFILCTANTDAVCRTDLQGLADVTVLEKPFPLSILIGMVSSWSKQEGLAHG
ncbi:MAG: response regulator [Planctomycetota bacterium]